jgi:hypothetical protein
MSQMWRELEEEEREPSLWMIRPRGRPNPRGVESPGVAGKKARIYTELKESWGTRQTLCHPGQEEKASSCIGVSFSKCMEVTSKRKASPGHLHPQAVSLLHPFPHCQVPTSWVRTVSKAWDRQTLIHRLAHRLPLETIPHARQHSGLLRPLP